MLVFKEVEEGLIAANRTLRVSGALRRVSSRSSRKARTISESSCSRASDDGLTFNLAAANLNNSWKL
jgi:hypothetical protein